MPIEVGDTLPSVTLSYLSDDGMKEISTDALFKGRKVVLFALPGAFTPVCSARHLPGYVEQLEAFKAKGVDQIVCLAVNDPFVMKAWGKEQGAEGKVFLLPDGSGALTRELGMEFDLTAKGLGVRCQRFALVAEDGVVKALAVEQAGAFEVSSAEAVLKLL
jgi:peroxiredoxin